MDLANCPQCGKLYVKNSYNTCPACIKETEEQYRKCAEYLRKNRGCSIQELSEGTGVPIRQITRFIREGRISSKDASNLRTPCEVCGAPIAEGAICDSCRARLTKDVSHLKEEERRKHASDHTHQSTFRIKDRFDR